jgi:hypothetical protein
MAASCLAAAESADANARERTFVAALRLALAGRFRRAADLLDDTLSRHPTDALAVKLVHALRFIAGDGAGMRRSLDAVAPFWNNHPLRGYWLGCRSFVLEEAGSYAEAEAAGRDGLDLAPDDAWGLHAVAHVHDMTGRPGDGVRWLAARTQMWAHCNNFGFHVWWHLALFHLDRGATGTALALYDSRVRAERTDDFRDIANAASLLLRLECEGADVGSRWEELGELAAARVDDGALVFADLHYQLALVRTGRRAEAEALAARLAGGAALPAHDQHEVAALSGVAMARGLLSFREGHWREALPELSAGLEKLGCIGGSHAQRDVFQRLTIEAAIRAGAAREAERLLQDRRRLRGAADGYAARAEARIAARRAVLQSAGIAAE